MILKEDNKNKFKSYFDPNTGFYARTGIIDENGKDTNIDPFMCSYPELLDIGIMQTCVCAGRCNVDCYQKAIDKTGNNMSLENFEKIIKQSTGKIFQCALGGAGDVDTHENFEEILKMCREYNIVPNFTTSGILMNDDKAKICKKYCGAVAVSQHSKLLSKILYTQKNNVSENEKNIEYIENEDYLNKLISLGWKETNEIKNDDLFYKQVYYEENNYTYQATKMLLNANVKTSIHYVLSKKSIEEAILRIKYNAFPKGINAVVFLLYKPVGLGKYENMLSTADSQVKMFFETIDNTNTNFKIGFDSCTCPGIVNYTKKIDLQSIDYCEGARFSAYIDANMNMMPCSFANQNPEWFMNLNEYTIQEVWDSKLFDKFRYSLKNSCSGCKHKSCCAGGCPLVNEITLCNSKYRDFKTK